MIECGDGSIYTGITIDLDRRMQQHRDGTASKYTRARGFNKLLYAEESTDRSTASKREYKIKKMDRNKKLMLIVNTSPENPT